ncbi:MAG: hypothetical protein ACKPKO_59050, partial [Candidatus Fonsibacter sp.]
MNKNTNEAQNIPACGVSLPWLPASSKMAPKQQQSGSFVSPKRGESASSSSGPQTDTIRFLVRNGAMKKEMNLV